MFSTRGVLEWAEVGKSNIVVIVVGSQPYTTALHLESDKLRGQAPLDLELVATLSYCIQGSWKPLPSKPVKFYSSGIIIGTATTDDSGKAKLELRLEKPGTYAFYAEFDGDANFIGC